MKEVKIINDISLGWLIIRDDFSELWLKGEIYNFDSKDLINNFRNKNKEDVKNLINNLDGNFSFIYQDKKKIYACVDKISSIPIFYYIGDTKIYISPKTYLLDDIIDFKNVNKNSCLAVIMSGYSVGNDTLYNNLKKLNCGEFIFYDKSSKNINFIDYYNYLPLSLKLDDTEENYKKKYIDTTFKIFKKLYNYSLKKNKKIAISMSAGLDTRLIVSTLREIGANNIIGFSYGLRNNSEAKAAKKLCDYLNIPWKFSEFSNYKLKKIILSNDFIKFRKITDTYYSTSDYSDYFAIKELIENNYLKNSIIVNGHSGDFIAGGHMLNDFYENDYKNDFLRNGARAIIKKHFRLWPNLVNRKNDETIENLLVNRMKMLNVEIKDEKQIFGILENIQLQERQSKHCLSRQRNYENFNLSWALPLWDNEYLSFWDKIPFNLKLNKKFYKDTLINKNISKVWKGNKWINLNSNIKINPWYLRIFRNFIKIFFIFSKKNWKLFDKKYFLYWIDNFCGFAPIKYSIVAKDKRLFRGSLSWVTDLYLRDKKLNKFNK